MASRAGPVAGYGQYALCVRDGKGRAWAASSSHGRGGRDENKKELARHHIGRKGQLQLLVQGATTEELLPSASVKERPS
jgi:hypothetical protein